MLLQHTSGLFNYTGEINPDGTFEPGIPLSGKEYVDNRFRTYRPRDLVAAGLAKPANFPPGTSWSYSNTNYILAGQLIERLTRTPYGFQVQQRVLRPLGLRVRADPQPDPALLWKASSSSKTSDTIVGKRRSTFVSIARGMPDDHRWAMLCLASK